MDRLAVKKQDVLYEDAREKMESEDDDRRDYSFKTSSSWDSSEEKSDDNDDW